jgi:Holliday junction resolvase
MSTPEKPVTLSVTREEAAVLLDFLEVFRGSPETAEKMRALVRYISTGQLEPPAESEAL